MIDTKISIKHFPDRKKPCLVLEQGNRGLVLGYFRSDEMVKVLDLAMGGSKSLVFECDKTINEMINEVY